MNVPDWLWQGLVEDAVWTGIAFSAAWAWKNSADIRERLRVVGKPTLTAGTQAQILYDVRGLAGTEGQILYNVEAPTPSLARRLEDFAAWYLHGS
jgi:hypothetical protein